MDKVFFKSINDAQEANFIYRSFAVCHMQKIKDKYVQQSAMESCRAYLSDIIFDKKGINPETIINQNSKNCHFSLDKDPTYLGFITTNFPQFLKNLPLLHAIEEQANVEKTIIHKTQIQNVYVIEGAPNWKDSCWKILIYSFLLKTFCYPTRDECNLTYWSYFEKYKDKWLKNITMPGDEEIFDLKVYQNYFDKTKPFDFASVHSNTGYVAIAQGSNVPMAKLLGITK